LAMGKPLVATGMAVEGLDLLEEVHYLKAETAAEFLFQINRLESDSDLCLAVATAGQRFVKEHYSWDVIGEKIAHAYQEIVRLKETGMSRTPKTKM